MEYQRVRKLCQAIILVGIVNFLVFSIVAFSIGGNAGDGMVAAGRYYIGVKQHYTQVSRSVFLCSLWHGYSLLVTHPLIFVSGIILWSLDKKERDKASRDNTLK